MLDIVIGGLELSGSNEPAGIRGGACCEDKVKAQRKHALLLLGPREANRPAKLESFGLGGQTTAAAVVVNGGWRANEGRLRLIGQTAPCTKLSSLREVTETVIVDIRGVNA